MERCGRLNGKMWKTKWKEVEDKMERCERQMGKSEDYQSQMQD